jgi:hypothetical protein
MQTTQTETMEEKGGWWFAYFVLMVLAFAGALVTGGHSPFELAKSIFFGFGLIGLWGFIRNVAIGWRRFWVGYFLLVMAGVIYSIGNLVLGPAIDSDFLVLAAVACVFTAPQWAALWLYAFRSSVIWRTSASGT